MNMNTFPLTFEQHLIFCIVAVLFMVLQFVRQRYWYQLVIAAAVGGSLLIYVNESNGWFYGIGILELVLMIAALVLYVVQSRKLSKAEDTEKQAETEGGEAVSAADAESADAAAEEVAEEPAAAETETTESAEETLAEAAAEENV